VRNFIRGGYEQTAKNGRVDQNGNVLIALERYQRVKVEQVILQRGKTLCEHNCDPVDYSKVNFRLLVSWQTARVILVILRLKNNLQTILISTVG
jgi:hypothetical protein